MLGTVLLIQDTVPMNQILVPNHTPNSEWGCPWHCAFAHTIIVLSLDNFICQVGHILLFIYLSIITYDVKFSLYLFYC